MNHLLKKKSNRLDKINEELKRELSAIINYELKDPKITGIVTITSVKITPDLRYAKAYISILNSKNNEETLRGLKNASGFLRSEIAKKINLRVTPEIVFAIDSSIEYGSKIDSILRDLKKEKK